MSTPTLGERLATVEEQVREISRSQTSEDERLDSIERTLTELKEQLERYKGFLGGIVFVFTCVGVFIKNWPFISGLFQK